tara:strand:- start:182 stop:424 length:243 start_codon:yes stop_codon:yes gene_type:complete
MKTKFKVGDKIECYDFLMTFKGTIRGTGTIEWSSEAGITKPQPVYLIEGTWDNETNVEWFDIGVKTLDSVPDFDIEILTN